MMARSGLRPEQRIVAGHVENGFSSELVGRLARYLVRSRKTLDRPRSVKAQLSIGRNRP